MPATREPVTKRANMPEGSSPSFSSATISHFEACIRSDLSFRLLSAGLRYEAYPPLLPQQPLVNGLPIERVECKMYISYASGFVTAAITQVRIIWIVGREGYVEEAVSHNHRRHRRHCHRRYPRAFSDPIAPRTSLNPTVQISSNLFTLSLLSI